MKVLILISAILLIVHADTSQKQDVKLKSTSPALNTLPQSQKYETFFQPMKLHQVQQVLPQQYAQPLQKPQYVPVQLVPKYYVPQAAPQAIMIIAQPALVPQSLLYNSQTQQLLNYFHANPQAKQQLLYGNYQPPQSTPTTYMHPVLASPSIGNYILAPAPQYQQVAQEQYQQVPQAQPQYQHAPQAQPQYQHVAQVQYQQAVQPQYQQVGHSHYQQVAPPQYHNVPQPQYQTAAQPQPQQVSASPKQQPAQLGKIAQLAQLAAHQFVSSQMKSAPAIVTGFEHFTPEQQAQIKAQLSTHLGSNYHAVASNAAGSPYSSKYGAEQESANDFVPSPQVKTDQVGSLKEAVKNRFSKNNN